MEKYMLNLKKLLTLALVFAVLLAAASLTSQLIFAPSGNSIGVGIYASVGNYSDATADKAGSAKISYTVCAVLVDKEKRVLDIEIDALDATASFTNEGKVVAGSELKTKGEKGNAYGMSGIGKTEWYLQCDAFEEKVIGKSAAEIASLVTDSGKGTDEIISAGCTITVTDFVKAINEAFSNLKEANAHDGDELRLGIVAGQSASDSKDATAEAGGKVQVTLTATGATFSGDKITAAMIDAINTDVKFTLDGSPVQEAAAKSKRALGDDYNMKKYAGAKLEWYEQADVFATRLVGLRKDGIATLISNTGKGNDDIVSAGCTIYVSDFVKSANKLFK